MQPFTALKAHQTIHSIQCIQRILSICNRTFEAGIVDWMGYKVVQEQHGNCFGNVQSAMLNKIAPICRSLYTNLIKFYKLLLVLISANSTSKLNKKWKLCSVKLYVNVKTSMQSEVYQQNATFWCRTELFVINFLQIIELGVDHVGLVGFQWDFSRIWANGWKINFSPHFPNIFFL